MKLNTRLSLFVVALLFSAFEMKAQESNPEKIVRPRVVAGTGLPVAEELAKNPSGPVTHLTPSVIQGRISEAQRTLKTPPMATAMRM